MAVKNLLCVVAANFAFEALAEQLVAHGTAQDGDRVEVSFDRGACHAFKGRLGTQEPGRPVCLGVNTPKQPEQRAADSQRQGGAHLLFHHVQPVAPVPAKALVTAIARQCYGHMLPCQLANPVGRYRRTVGIRFIVKARQRIDEIEVVALDGIDEMIGLVTIGHLLGKFGFIKRGIGEGDRAGIDRVVGKTRHEGDHGTRVDSAGKEGTEGHFRHQAKADRFAQA